MAKDPAKRFATALEMAKRIEAAGPLATPLEVGAWVEKLGESSLAHRAALLSRVEHAAAPSEPSVAEMVSRQSTSNEMPTSPRTRWLRIGGVVGAAAFAFGLTAMVLRACAPTPIDPAKEGPTEAPGPSAVPSSTASMTGPPSIDLDPPTVADPPRVVDAGARDAGAAGRTIRRDKKIVAKPPPNCDPPFVVDKNGRKEYKQDCL